MKKLSAFAAVVVPLLLVLGTSGCGGDDASNGTTTAPGPTDEEVVAELAQEQIAALKQLDFETVYESRSPDYRSRVSYEEFESFLTETYAPIIPQVESGESEVELTNLVVRIDGEYAYLTGELALDGTVLVEYTDESPDIWQKIDGTWYNLETDASFPGYDASELPEQ